MMGIDEAEWDSGCRCTSKERSREALGGRILARQSKGGQRWMSVINTKSASGLYGSVGQATFLREGSIHHLSIGAERELPRYGVTVNVLPPERARVYRRACHAEIREDGVDRFDRRCAQFVAGLPAEDFAMDVTAKGLEVSGAIGFAETMANTVQAWKPDLERISLRGYGRLAARGAEKPRRMIRGGKRDQREKRAETMRERHGV